MVILQLHKRDLTNPRSTYLRAFRDNLTSQCGEDGILRKIFSLIGTTTKYCVEFGAWDGKLFSNVYSLLTNGGWTGTLIEGNPQKFPELERTYAGRSDLKLVNRFVDLGANRLDEILTAAQAPAAPDLVSIDIDGMDWYVWRSVTRFRPRMVIVEFNPSIPNDVSFVQEENFSFNHGCSLRALVALAKEKRYELVATTDWNAFFAEESEFPKFQIADNSIDAMHDGSDYQTKFFQLYDGTLVIAGCTRLLWKGWPICLEDIQVVPLALRRFEDAAR
jgi:hypothetical protein